MEQTKSPDYRDLIAAARAVYGDFALAHNFSAGSVGAAIRTAGGNVYTGICIDVACGMGFCAEHAAVAEMLKHRESEIVAMVAVSGDAILPPCGRCRELVAQINPANMNCQVVLPGQRIVALRELLPEHWLDANRT
jgi:cytidine deaminase